MSHSSIFVFICFAWLRRVQCNKNMLINISPVLHQASFEKTGTQSCKNNNHSIIFDIYTLSNIALIIKSDRMHCIWVYFASSVRTSLLLCFFVSEWFSLCVFEVPVGLVTPGSCCSRLQYKRLTLLLFIYMSKERFMVLSYYYCLIFFSMWQLA